MTIQDAPMADLLKFYHNGFVANALSPLNEEEVQMMKAINNELVNRVEIEAKQ